MICCYDLTSGWCGPNYYKDTQVATAFPIDTMSEILIVGTGKVFGPLSPAVRSVIRGYGLQVDMMSTVSLSLGDCNCEDDYMVSFLTTKINPFRALFLGQCCRYIQHASRRRS